MRPANLRIKRAASPSRHGRPNRSSSLARSNSAASFAMSSPANRFGPSLLMLVNKGYSCCTAFKTSAVSVCWPSSLQAKRPGFHSSSLSPSHSNGSGWTCMTGARNSIRGFAPAPWSCHIRWVPLTLRSLGTSILPGLAPLHVTNQGTLWRQFHRAGRPRCTGSLVLLRDSPRGCRHRDRRCRTCKHDYHSCRGRPRNEGLAETGK